MMADDGKLATRRLTEWKKRRLRRRAWAVVEVTLTFAQWAFWVYIGLQLGHLLKGCAH